MSAQNQELVGLMNKRDTDIRNLQMQIDSLRNQLQEYSKVSRGIEERDMKISSLLTDLDMFKRNLTDAENSLRQKDDYLRHTE